MTLLDDIPDGCEVITLYDKPDGKVQYCIIEGTPYINVHSNNGKYSRGILKSIKYIEVTYGETLAILPFTYLVDFYKKHYIVNVIDINMKLYLIRRRG